MYHYKKGEEQYGPVSMQVLQQMADKGELESMDLVWREGMTDWFPAYKFGVKFKKEKKLRKHGKHHKRVDCYFLFALISLVLFPITGFFALISSIQAYFKDKQGRTAEAIYDSEETVRWGRISIFIGIPAWFIGAGLFIALHVIRLKGSSTRTEKEIENPPAYTEGRQSQESDIYEMPTDTPILLK